MIPSYLALDPKKEVEHIVASMRQTATHFRRRGFVLGISGGVDSSVCAALGVEAVGTQRMVTLQMPETHSESKTLELSGLVAEHFLLPTVIEDITSQLESFGFYERYAQAISQAIPGYTREWKSKVVLSHNPDATAIPFFYIIAQDPQGTMHKERLSLDAYLGVLAATNFKQRIRKMLEYYYADKHNYCVIGTPNRLEYDQGFFVKLGDGAADIKPIAHLYKTQVYELAKYLGVPDIIVSRPPTTDTYALPQGQDEFYFSLPYNIMDICLYGKNNGLDKKDIARDAGISLEQVEHTFVDIDTKRKATRYLHTSPILVEPVSEVA